VCELFRRRPSHGLNYCMPSLKTKARYITRRRGRLYYHSPLPHPQPKALQVAMPVNCPALVPRTGWSHATRHLLLLPVSLRRKSLMSFPLSHRRFPRVHFIYLQTSREPQFATCQLSQLKLGNTRNKGHPWFEVLHLEYRRSNTELASLAPHVVGTICFRCVFLLSSGTV
jgi:hypothetical protein